MPNFKVACIQNTAGRDPGPNTEQLLGMIAEAAGSGADLVAMPEMCTMIEPDDAVVLAQALEEADAPALKAFMAAAREAEIWLLVGSLLVKVDDGRVANRSIMIAPDGSVAARYDKLHMFDVSLKGGEAYKESTTVHPGARAVSVDLPWGRLGMSICYDLRFAALYRALAQGGAQIISAPAAFTHTTGTAHWHVLVRARAIETGSYVIAPNQCGTHADGRRTYGHSLIVDPWGEVLADGGAEPGIIYGDIDLQKSTDARQRIPALQHDRVFSGPEQTPLRRAG